MIDENYRLTQKLQIDPKLESAIQTKAQGLHSIWNTILRSHFSIWYVYYKSTIEDLQEKNSSTLGNYSRRLQDYSRLARAPSSLVMVQVLFKTSDL
jgi:hypothetical protein